MIKGGCIIPVPCGWDLTGAVMAGKRAD